MNLILEDVIMKDSSGTKKLPQLIIRGNLILYTILPSKIKNSPLLNKVKELGQAGKSIFSPENEQPPASSYVLSE